MPKNIKDINQESCHCCQCAAHCEERLCGDCKECTACGCWSCQAENNPAIYDADLLS